MLDPYLISKIENTIATKIVENYKFIKTQLLLKRREYLLRKNKRVRNENRMYNKMNTQSLENSPSKYYHGQNIQKAYKNTFIDRLSYIEEKRKYRENKDRYIYQQRQKSKEKKPDSKSVNRKNKVLQDIDPLLAVQRLYGPKKSRRLKFGKIKNKFLSQSLDFIEAKKKKRKVFSAKYGEIPKEQYIRIIHPSSKVILTNKFSKEQKKRFRKRFLERHKTAKKSRGKKDNFKKFYSLGPAKHSNRKYKPLIYDRIRAAITIQKHIRGYLDWKSYQSLKYYKDKKQRLRRQSKLKRQNQSKNGGNGLIKRSKVFLKSSTIVSDRKIPVKLI